MPVVACTSNSTLLAAAQLDLFRAARALPDPTLGRAGNPLRASPFNEVNEPLLEAYHRLRPSPKDLTLFDVGSNKGLATLDMLSLWGRQWRLALLHKHPTLCKTMSPSLCEPTALQLYAFDLLPDNARLLEQIRHEFGLGSNVHTHALAMKEAPGAPIVVCRQASILGTETTSIRDSTLPRKLQGADRICSSVHTESIDHFLSSRPQIRHVHVLKIDAEGYDAAVLTGAENLLAARRVDVVIFECCHLWPTMRDNITLMSVPERRGEIGLGRAAPSLWSISSLSEPWGYELYLLSTRNMLRLSPRLYPRGHSAWGQFARCGWCNFALIRSSAPPLERLPAMINLDLETLCAQATPSFTSAIDEHTPTRQGLPSNAMRPLALPATIRPWWRFW